MVPPTQRLENQPPTTGHSRKVVIIQTEASLPNYPCGLRGIKRCKCTVIVQDTSTSSSSSSAFLFFLACVHSAVARSACTIPACQRSPTHCRKGAPAVGEAGGRIKTGRACWSAQMCGGTTSRPIQMCQRVNLARRRQLCGFSHFGNELYAYISVKT